MKIHAFGQGIRNIGLQLTAAGAGLVTPFIGAAKVFASLGDSLTDLSARTGFTVETLSALAFGVQLVGADIESLERGIKFSQRSITDALLGSEDAAKKLQLLGLSVEELFALNPEKRFRKLVDAISKLPDAGLRAAAAQEFFGRGNTKLLPIFDSGVKALDELRATSDRLGITLSTKAAAAGDLFNDTYFTMWTVVKRVAAAVGEALSPTLQDLIERITRAAVQVKKWVDQNQKLVLTLFKLSVGLTLIGAALVATGISTIVLSKLFGLLSTAVFILNASFNLVIATFAFLLTPLGVLVTTITLLTVTLVDFASTGSTALRWLGERFTALLKFAIRIFEGLSDALMAGDIPAAARVLWAALRLIWLEGTEQLANVWARFGHVFLSIAVDVFHGVQAAAVSAVDGIRDAWARIMTGLGEMWIDLAFGIVVTMAAVENQVTRIWNRMQNLVLPGFDLEQANIVADDALTAQLDKFMTRRNELVASSREQLAGDLLAIETEHEAKMASIGVENLSLRRGLDAEFAERINESNEELAAARAEWEAALADAKKRKESVEALDVGASLADRLQDDLEATQDILNLVRKESIETAGTFTNAQLLALQGGSSANERTANATERTALGVEEVRRIVAIYNLAFAP